MRGADAGRVASGIHELDPLAVADLMVLEALARGSGTVVLEARGGHHALQYDSGTVQRTLARLPSEQAEAAIARLAIIAGLSVGQAAAGRLRVCLSSQPSSGAGRPPDLLLVVRTAADGLGAELHVLSSGPLRAGPPAETEEASRYRLLEERGRGGMGVVYRALHVPLHKEVALKVLSPRLARHPWLVEQFVVEARAACRARHPNIVDVTDFGRLPDGRDFLVMEWIDWPTLSARLKDGPLPQEQAVAIASGIAAGLAAAHARGVVHRDLKPSNVFVSDDNEVKVGDFGLAQAPEEEGSSSATELLMGTVGYMAPEQALGGRVDPRADVYAFGCILFEMLAGTPVFSADTTRALLELHRTAPPPLLPHVAPPLSALLASALAKEPAQRPADFEAVRVMLGQVPRARRPWSAP